MNLSIAPSCLFSSLLSAPSCLFLSLLSAPSCLFLSLLYAPSTAGLLHTLSLVCLLHTMSCVSRLYTLSLSSLYSVLHFFNSLPSLGPSVGVSLWIYSLSHALYLSKAINGSGLLRFSVFSGLS